MSKRGDIEKEILKTIGDMKADKINIELYTNMFKRMNNKEFDSFMLNLEDNILNVIVPVDAKISNISVENNLKLLKRFGRPLTQHLYRETVDGPTRKTLNKNAIYILPFRRTKQTVDKGVSVAENNKSTDSITGQVSGDSRSSKMSNSELQLLVSMDLSEAAIEMNQLRADADTSNLMISGIKKYGTIDTETILKYAKPTRTTNTLKAYFNAMHLKIDL